MNNKPKILIFATAYAPHVGGAEIALREITARLKNEFDFVILTVRLSQKDKEYEKLDNIEIYRIGYGSRSLINKTLFALFSAPFKAWQLSRQSGNEFKLMFALQASFGGVAGSISKILLKLPLLVNFQEGNELKNDNFAIKLMRRLVLSSADSITAISNYLYFQARISGADDHKLSIIPNGVDLNIFKPVSYDGGIVLREKYNLPKNAKIIVTASRLVYKNGIDVLIEAFAKLDLKEKLLLILGDGVLLAEYKKICQKLNISDKVQFWPSQPHAKLAEIIACADVFARPSRTEGLGNAFLESMACGTPIVATNVGGIQDFLMDEITGLVVKVDDSEDIAKKIKKYFYDEVLYNKIRNNGIELINDFYSWDKIAESYHQEFYRLISLKSKKHFTGKRVLIITQKMDKKDDLLGFFPTWVNKMSEQVAKIDVVTLFWGDYKCPENVSVHSLGKEYGTWRIWRAIKFVYFMFRYGLGKNLIFAHMSPIFAILAWPFAKIYGVKLALWYVHRSVTTKLKIAEKLVDIIYTTTPESFRLKSDKVKFVGHGIDVDYLKPKYEREYPSGKNINFIAVGRLSPIKNYETLISAMKMLKDMEIDFKLNIIGEAVMTDDYEYEVKLKKMVNELNLDENINFVGKLPFTEIANYYHQSDIAFNMAPTGGLDKAVLEPMACGLPVLVSNEAFRPFFGQFANDLIFCYNNPADLAQKVANLLKKDIVKIGKYLSHVVEQKHNVNILIKQILDE